MRLIVQDLHARLTGALGPDIPVLLPEERELPTQGRRPGQTGGLSGYLQAHARGYVQLEEPQGISDDGVTAVWWVPVAALAPTPGAAEALALRVRRALAGSARVPGAYLPRIPDTARLLTPGAYLARPTYEILAIDGLLAVQE